jgi:5S rRNA maturation endonuclease (ribonuclease M5)
MNSRPNAVYQTKVCIICEGKEEKEYLQKLKNLDVWNRKYFFSFKNANSASNIFPLFQNEYQNCNFDIILIFCDTDKPPHKEYSKIKNKINQFLGKRINIMDKITIFANPCTMQIFLSHFEKVSLSSHSKRRNAPLIEKLTGIKNYDAHNEQIAELCSKITKPSYFEMKSRIKEINFADNKTPSTNFFKFLEYFETSNEKWVIEINKAMETKK